MIGRRVKINNPRLPVWNGRTGTIIQEVPADLQIRGFRWIISDDQTRRTCLVKTEELTYEPISKQHSDLKNLYNLIVDSGDPWGSCISFLFAIADNLYIWDSGELIPDAWNYNPGPCGPDTFEERFRFHEIGSLIQDGKVSLQDLVDFGNILNRYADILKAQGKDY